jgi:hypothetical protein
MTSTSTLPRVRLGEVADRVNEVLDNVDYTDGFDLMSDADLLNSVAGSIGTLAKLQAVLLTQLAEAEHRGSTTVRHGIRTSSWLTHVLHSHSLERARDQVRQARAMRERFPQARDGLRAGQLSVEQAEAVVSTLGKLPAELDTATMAEAEQTMLGFTDSHNPTDLRRLGHHLVDVVAPEIGEAETAKALERLEARAQDKRALFFWDDNCGGVGVSGMLPPVDGARLRDVIAAITARPRPSGEDPSGDDRSATQKRADALAEVVDGYLKSGEAPVFAGDHVRVAVTIDYRTLLGDLGHATLADGSPISAGEARRLACDADILPAVLDTNSVPLDIGQHRRLFSQELRQALVLRDRGCCFPGCEAPPSACQGHHIQPWWDNGPTALHNGALVCPYHHRLVEPDPHLPVDMQWQLSLDPRGLPRVRPPVTVDPLRPQHQHARYIRRRC